MTSVSGLRKKAAARAATKAQMYSTSQARANFAEALGVAQVENTVIGFDRYGRLVAALVPIDAVRMLAGQGAAVEPAVRAKIERMARLFLFKAPEAKPVKGASKSEVREERAAFKHKRSKKKPQRIKRSKAAGSKRHPKVSARRAGAKR
mgnify:CR=1 FL=1